MSKSRLVRPADKAAALAQRRLGRGLALQPLNVLPADRVATYQPYWVARSHVLHNPGRGEEASGAKAVAVDLTEDPAAPAFLMQRFVRRATWSGDS